MNRRVLLVAFHFPPLQGSSGLHRTLAFARYLKEYGWQPTVLTVSESTYGAVREENCDMIPAGVRVVRARAFDAQRDLSVRGWYPGVLAVPDRWQSWIISGIRAGLDIIRHERPAAMLSTYPIASAHCVAWGLRVLTGVPWVADFRDPMLQADWPSGRIERWAFKTVESMVVGKASAMTFTTRSAVETYRSRYPSFRPERIRVIENGYDEEAFPACPPPSAAGTGGRAGRIVLLHSGVLYPEERNPTAFFEAIRRLVREGIVSAENVEFRMRASGNEGPYREAVERLGLTGIVTFEPSLPYRDAVKEMMDVDGLMVFQANNCNSQVPAKVYEYLFVRKPILGLATPEGDTGQLLLRVGVADVAPLEDADAMADTIRGFLESVRRGGAKLPDEAVVKTLSRRARTGELAELLDEIVTSEVTG